MISYREGYLYQVSKLYRLPTPIIPPATILHEFFTLHVSGQLYIYDGYAWDGASWCPEWLVPPECSCPHDALCQMMRYGLLDYDTYAPQVHGLLMDMVMARRGKIVAGIVHKAVVMARGGYPSNSNDNPELADPKQAHGPFGVSQ